MLDVFPDASKNLHVGRTLKRPSVPSLPCEGAKHIRLEDSSYDSNIIVGNDRTQISMLNDVAMLCTHFHSMMPLIFVW